MACPSYSQAPGRSQQPPKGPSPQTQRGTGHNGRRGPEVRTHRDTLAGPLPALLQELQPLPGCEAHQWEAMGGLSWSPFQLQEVAAWGCGTHYGMQGKSILGLHKIYGKIYFI